MALTRRIAISYTHVQASPDTTWTIVHNCGGYPIVDAYTVHNGETLKILPAEVTFVDANTCTLTFSVPRSGFATVV
jgi:hypothetical protein